MMKKYSILLAIVLMSGWATLQAQTADEILNNYFVDGEEVQDVSYYFFETENFVPIAIHSEIKQGQAKGMMSEITFSDYQEVEGLYMPFTMSQGVKGQGGQPVTMDSIELNPEVSDSDFAFPAEE